MEQPIFWDDQVQDQIIEMRAPDYPHAPIKGAKTLWDGISLVEAVKRWRALPDADKAL
jgi:hypothetical protein